MKHTVAVQKVPLKSRTGFSTTTTAPKSKHTHRTDIDVAFPHCAVYKKTLHLSSSANDDSWKGLVFLSPTITAFYIPKPDLVWMIKRNTLISF